MSNTLNIKMTSQDGLTLHTAGTYCEKDIQIIPDFGGDGACSGDHIIEVEELPTENIDEGAIYKLTIEAPFSAIIVGGDEPMDLGAFYEEFLGYKVEYYTVNTKPTENIKMMDETNKIFPCYFVEDENDIFICVENTDTGEIMWLSFGVLIGSEDSPFPFGGVITNMSEATSDRCYYALGGGTVINYYKYRDPELIDVILYTDSASSLGPDTSGLYYASTKPTTDIKVSDPANGGVYIYYIEDEHDLFVYGNIDGTGINNWYSISRLWTSSTYTFQGAITDSTEATETGYYAVITGGGFKELIIPTGTITLTEEGEHDVSRFANAIVEIVGGDPTVYIGKTVDDLPTDVAEGSHGIVTHGNSNLSGVAIPVTWKTPGYNYLWYGSNVWYKDDNVYYSYYGTQYIFDKETRTWKNKTWSGLTSFDGEDVWTDGTNTYYSNGSKQYVLNGDAWEAKTWNGFTPSYREYIWSDGTNIFYSNGSNQYVLNGDTWETKTWNGLTSFNGNYIWKKDDVVYYSYYDKSYSGAVTNRQYVLNGDTWETKTWYGDAAISGSGIWTDGTDIYYADDYVLDGDTWKTKVWYEAKYGGFGGGRSVWTDGTHTYYSSYYNSYYTRQFLLAPAAALYIFAQEEWRIAADLGQAAIADKKIYANGVYKASNDNLNGYSSVTIQIPAVYTATTLDDIPADAPNGSIAMILEVDQ